MYENLEPDDGPLPLTPDGPLPLSEGERPPDGYPDSGIVQHHEDNLTVYIDIADIIRTAADERVAALYADDPALHEYALQKSGVFTGYMGDTFNVDEQTDPAMPVMKAGLTKLVFSFTDTTNHADTLTDLQIFTEITGLWQMIEANESLGSATFQALAKLVDLHGSHTLLSKLTLEEQGELDGLRAYDKLIVVKSMLELAILPSTDEPGRPQY